MRTILIIIYFFYFSTVFSQQNNNVSRSLVRQYNNAEALFRAQKYDEALDAVEQIAERDSTFIDNWLLKAEILHQLKDSEKEINALEKIVSISPEYSPLAYKRLVELFFKSGQYALALKNGEYYQAVDKTNFEINRIIESSKFSLAQISENQQKIISIHDTSLNSSLNEYWPIVSIDDSVLYFTRLLRAKTQLPQEDLFMSKLDSTGWGFPQALPAPLNTLDNEGAMSISADGKIILFTGCGRSDGRGSCDIYISILNDNRWTPPMNIGSPINTGAWEAQPSLSADGAYLFFTSNRQGGYGGKDIWVSYKITTDRDGFPHFSEPVNLGKILNTVDDDYSPFIHADGKTLYFVSNGRIGMGGADIYMSRFSNGSWSESINLGYPINTRDNDDGLTISPSGKIALISSNRIGSNNQSKDIYRVELKPEMRPTSIGYLKGIVINSEINDSISAEVLIENIDTNEKINLISDQRNGFAACLEIGQHYALHCRKDGFQFYSQFFDLKSENTVNKALNITIALSPLKREGTIVLNNIFFDFNASTLKSESNVELNQIVEFLQSNKLLKAEVEGHTDTIGSDDYNLKLSEQRAKAVYDYLCTKVEPLRLSYRGLGSTKPVATNETEEGRALNRRTELRIISF